MKAVADIVKRLEADLERHSEDVRRQRGLVQSMHGAKATLERDIESAEQRLSGLLGRRGAIADLLSDLKADDAPRAPTTPDKPVSNPAPKAEDGEAPQA